MSVYKYFLVIVTLLNCTVLFAQQRLDMEGTAIIGNKELPRVLYIVPWKPAQKISLSTPPFNSVLDEVFQPVERSTFNRQLKYYNTVYSRDLPEHKPGPK